MSAPATMHAGEAPGAPRLNVLYLYSRGLTYCTSTNDYISAFGRYSRHNVFYRDIYFDTTRLDFGNFDVLIIGYCVAEQLSHLSHRLIEDIRNFRGYKLIIIQDEYYNSHLHHDRLTRMRIDAVVTTIPNPADRRVAYYGEELAHLEFVHALTGYVADDMKNRTPWIPFRERKWKLGYRGRSLPFIYGDLTREKWLIGARMKEICAEKGVPANIAVDDESRIYGRDWVDFIRNCRGTLGTESGSNVFDFGGKALRGIREYLKSHPDADYQTVHDLFLKDIDGKIKMNQISPRIYEAIAYGSALVLFRGEYSGVVEADRHYIPLEKDFSNVDEVLAKLDDIPLLEEMTERAFADVIASDRYSSSAYVARIDDFLEKRVKPSGWRPVTVIGGWTDPSGTTHKTASVKRIEATCSTLHTHDSYRTSDLFLLSVNPSILPDRLIAFLRRMGKTRVLSAILRNDAIKRWMKSAFHMLRRAS